MSKGLGTRPLDPGNGLLRCWYSERRDGDRMGAITSEIDLSLLLVVLSRALELTLVRTGDVSQSQST